MDIKSYVLLGGGLLIAVVIAHGFWIAWQARREPLRLDIVPDLVPDNVDDMERLRGELPNGGGRIVTKPEQEPLNLQTTPPKPEPAAPPRPRLPGMQSAANRSEPIVQDETTPPRSNRPAVRPGKGTLNAELFGDDVDFAAQPAAPAAQPAAPAAQPAAPAAQPAAPAARVTEVSLPDEAKGSEPAKHAPLRERGLRRHGPEPTAEIKQLPVEELIVIRLLAAPGMPYTGNELFNAMRDKGLRYGDMNIFHKASPLSKVLEFSVANAVEPGSFDLADIDNFSSQGLTFFLQLPGPELPRKSFDDMLRIARELADELGGDLKDEQMSDITAQTVEHYRQRIADFARRRLSRRA